MSVETVMAKLIEQKPLEKVLVKRDTLFEERRKTSHMAFLQKSYFWNLIYFIVPKLALDFSMDQKLSYNRFWWDNNDHKPSSSIDLRGLNLEPYSVDEIMVVVEEIEKEAKAKYEKRKSQLRSFKPVFICLPIIGWVAYAILASDLWPISSYTEEYPPYCGVYSLINAKKELEGLGVDTLAFFRNTLERRRL